MSLCLHSEKLIILNIQIIRSIARTHYIYIYISHTHTHTPILSPTCIRCNWCEHNVRAVVAFCETGFPCNNCHKTQNTDTRRWELITRDYNDIEQDILVERFKKIIYVKVSVNLYGSFFGLTHREGTPASIVFLKTTPFGVSHHSTIWWL